LLTIASRELPPDPASVAAARDVVGLVVDHLPRRAREAVELVTSELATNSVVHAGTSFEIFAAADDDTVEVVVADRAGWVSKPDTGQPLGNGLLLVGLLASDWAAVMETSGKRVWAKLEIDDVPTY